MTEEKQETTEEQPKHEQTDLEEIRLDQGQSRAVVSLLMERQQIIQRTNQELARIEAALKSVADAFLAKANKVGAEFIDFGPHPEGGVVLKYRPGAKHRPKRSRSRSTKKE